MNLTAVHSASTLCLCAQTTICRAFLTLVIIVMWLLQGCSDNSVSVPPEADRHYLFYDVLYDAGADSTFVEVSVRNQFPAGNRIYPGDSALCVIEGDTLPFLWNSYAYKKAVAGRIDTIDFLYQDQLDRIYRNTALILDSVEIPADLDTISRSVFTTLLWLGQPLGAGEEVTCLVTRSDSTATFTVAARGATAVRIIPQTLSQLSGGQATVELFRASTSPAEQSALVGASIRSIYRSKSRPVILGD